MTVYIDDMYKYPMGQFRHMKMSHMIADNEQELHVMAQSIGLKRKWFQGDHYDVSISCRTKAINLGAVPIELRVLSRMSMNRRRGYTMGTPETCEQIAKVAGYFHKQGLPIPSVLLEGCNHDR